MSYTQLCFSHQLLLCNHISKKLSSLDTLKENMSRISSKNHRISDEKENLLENLNFITSYSYYSVAHLFIYIYIYTSVKRFAENNIHNFKFYHYVYFIISLELYCIIRYNTSVRQLAQQTNQVHVNIYILTKEDFCSIYFVDLL